MSRTVYIYTTNSQSKRSIAEIDGEVFHVKLKLGQTMINDLERISQQDSTSNSEKLDRIYRKEDIPDHITDKKWHKAMEKAGYVKSRDDKDREWFTFPDCLTAEEAKQISVGILFELISGKIAVEDFEPDDYQIEFANWSMSRFISGETHLLNGSKMRSGKCLMGHEASKINNFKKILISSGKPGVGDGWGELLIGGEKAHIRYADNHFHHYKKTNKNSIEFSKEKDTVFVGLQYVHTNIDNYDDLFLQQVLNIKWDVLYLDEQHFAIDTEKTQRFINLLKEKNPLIKIVEFGGTSFKAMLANKFSKENTWAWDYVSEQKRRTWLLENDPNSDAARRFKYLPKVNYAMMHIPDKVKQYINDANFNLGRDGLWAVDKTTKDYVFKQAVVEFIDTVRVQGYKNIPDKFLKTIDVHTRYSMWVLPDNVRAIKLLRDLLEQHPYFKKYVILVASGDEVKDDKVVKDKIKRIEEGMLSAKGVIVLTCGRFLEGSTIPEYCSVHQMNSDKSAASYFQSSFRAGSPWEKGDKQEVCIYDWDAERFIQMVYTLGVDSCDREKGQTPNEWITTEFSEVSDVYDFDGKTWTLTGAETIVQKATEDILSNTSMFKDIGLIDPNQITDSMIAVLVGADYSSSDTGSSNLNTNGMTTGSVSVTTKSQSQQNEKTKDPVVVSRLQISEAIKNIPNLIFISYDYAFKITSVYDIVKCHEIELVKEQTGLTTGQWGVIINAINVDKLNRRIDAYVNA
jgi:hypothetical protein